MSHRGTQRRPDHWHKDRKSVHSTNVAEAEGAPSCNRRIIPAITHCSRTLVGQTASTQLPCLSLHVHSTRPLNLDAKSPGARRPKVTQENEGRDRSASAYVAVPMSLDSASLSELLLVFSIY
jgi:hypothetical protein